MIQTDCIDAGAVEAVPGSETSTQSIGFLEIPRMNFMLNPHLKHKTLAPVDATPVQKFHEQLPGYQISPLHQLPKLANELQVKQIFVKDESDRFGLPAFKILGASWGTYRAVCGRLGLPVHNFSLEEVGSKAQAAGLIIFAATAGNHGRAVTYIARTMGIPAHVYVPRDLDDHTKQTIEKEGADIYLSDHYDQAVKDAESGAIQTNGVLVQDTAWSGYEEIPAWITDGYATMFREIDDQLALSGVHATHVITPVGVGSLAHAVVKHYKSAMRKPTKVLAVEPEMAACLQTSLRVGEATSIGTGQTICNGMNCGTVSSTAWPNLRDHIDASVTVSDPQAHSGVEELAKYGIEAGPCGGACLAALSGLTLEQNLLLNLDETSTVVMLCTEGKRPYDVASA